MELTPEERQRIYEEEKARLEIRQELQPPKENAAWKVVGCMILSFILFFVIAVLISGVGTTRRQTTETGVVAKNTGNIAHDRLAASGATIQALTLGRIVNEGCTGESAFFMGQDPKTKEAYWSVRCANGKSYEVRIEPNSTGSTDVVDCAILKALNAGVECFRHIEGTE